MYMYILKNYEKSAPTYFLRVLKIHDVAHCRSAALIIPYVSPLFKRININQLIK